MKKIHLSIYICLAAVLLSCASKTPAGNNNSYQGHGQESLKPEIVAKYAAKPLPPDLSRKIQNLLDVRSPGAGMLTPDKKHFYFSWKVTGVNQIWKLKSPLSFPVQVTGGEDVTNLLSIDPNGKFIVVSRDRAGEENPGIYLQPTEGGPLKLVQHKPKVQTLFQFISRDGKWIYYRANDQTPESYTIYRYNVAEAKSEALFVGKGYWSIVDYQDNGKLLLEKTISNVATEIYLFDPATKALEPIIGQGEMEEHSVRFGLEEGEYFVLTNKISDFRRLYLYKNKKLQNLTGDLQYDVESYTLDHQHKHLLFETNEAGYTHLHAMDPKTYQSVTLPEFKGAEHVMAGAWSYDGETVMISVSNSQSPKMSYSFDFKTNKLTQWVVPSAPEVNLSHFAVAKLEHYVTRDGVKIPMFVRRPLQCEDAEKSCPVVVHFHGGPEAQSFPGFSVVAQMFVDEGFIFVEPNVRGSDGYGKTWLHLDDGPKRLNVITDIPDCADWIKKNWLDSKKNSPKIGVMGWSYGGYSTQMAMTRFAGSYDAGVALVGMSNLKTFLMNTAPYRRALRIAEYGDPEKDAAALDQLSAINYIGNVKAPLLLVQGVSDPRVPAGEALQMQEAMQAKGLKSELILFADEGHGSQKRSNQVLELGHTIQFFKKYLFSL